MGKRVLKAGVSVSAFSLLLLFCAAVQLFGWSSAATAGLPVVSGENLYTTISGGSAGTSPDISDGVLRGRVTDQETGGNVVNMPIFAKQTSALSVQLFDASSGEIRGQANLKMADTKTYETVTASDGTYLLRGVQTGVYTVWAHEQNGAYLKKIHSGPTDTANEGTPVFVLEGGADRVINFSLQRGAGIGGKIIGKADGVAIGGVLVTVLDSRRKNPVSSSHSDTDGNYLVQGLPDGQYIVKTENNAFVDSYFGNDKTPQSASVISILNRETVQGIDFSLERNASVEGMVLDGKGLALSGIRVAIYEYDGQTIAPQPAQYARTDANGIYKIDKLPPGTYTLKAEASAVYLTAVYGSAADGDGMTVLEIQEGLRLTGVDFTLTLGGVLKGQALNATTGGPAVNARIEIFDAVTGKSSGHTLTDKSGRYIVDRLPFGSYFIQAGSKKFAMTFHANAESLEKATAIHLSSDASAIDIDFSLIELPVLYTGSISGKIVWEYDQSLLQRGCVQAYMISSNKFAGSDCSGADGRYIITELADGDYRVFVRTFAGFISEFYNDIGFQNPDSATPVSIDNGLGAENIDFFLSRIGSVAGTVFRKSDGREIGTYEIKAVPGNYQVQVNCQGSGYLNPPAEEAKRAVTISDGQTSGAVDFVLSLAGGAGGAGGDALH